MLNYIWAFMMLGGILFGSLTGKTEAVSEAVITASQEAVELCIAMTGVMAMWMGVMEIAQSSGLTEKMMRLIRPVMTFLFPDIPEEHPARTHIATNMIANFLGLGWAATPAGLKAMKSLTELEKEREQRNGVWAASHEMCTFLILNISSLQLIPVNIIAYRSQYGSADPSAVVGPGIIATCISTLTAVIFCKCMDRYTRKNTTFQKVFPTSGTQRHS